jgi:hypothetical protein
MSEPYLDRAEVSEHVEQDGLVDALQSIPAQHISPDWQELRWWWTVAHNYRLPTGEFSARDLERVRAAL